MFRAICTPVNTCRVTCDEDSGGGGDSGSIEVLNVDIVADVAATVPYEDLRQFNVLGQFYPGDGMGGIWSYFQGSVAVPDGYYVILPPGGVGRYVKLV